MSTLMPLTNENWFSAFGLMEEFFKESPLFSRIGYDPLIVIEQLAKTVTSSQRFARIGYINDMPAGIVVARRVDLLFSKRTQAADIIFYVKPKYRTTLLIKRLISEYEKWAWEDPSCCMVQLTALGGASNDRNARLAKLLGYGTMGHVLIKER